MIVAADAPNGTIEAAVERLDPGLAAETGPRTERVSYGDLNLASEAGVKALDRRLDRAVRRVCGDDHRNLVMSSSVKNCIETARASIRPQREFAIARANGQDGKAWAENNRGQAVVALAE